MFFLHEFLQGVIVKYMEDPKKRDEKFREHCQKTAAAARQLRVNWYQPSKTYGFWQSEKANAKYHVNLDPGVQKLSGRVHPFEY
eukprot:jgi/Astpho2/2559/Aster-x1085